MHTILRGPDDWLLIPQRKKYFVVSDLHLEFRTGQEDKYWEAFPEHRGCKVCLCAGDLTSFGLPEAIVTKHFVRLCNRFEKVIYVPGNHEYYGSYTADVERKLRALEYNLGSALKILWSGEPYVFDGQRFVGDTMWFPDRPEVHIYRRMINDSVQIKGLFPWCFTKSHLFLSWIRQHLQEDDIVITHHIPTDADTHPMWKASQTQPYFLNIDTDRYLAEANTIKPKAWIYGHTHDKHHFHVGRTQFICNPVGYPGERGYLPEAAEPALYEI